MMSEIYPTRIRARAVALSTTFLWLAGFTGPLAFPKIAGVSEKMIGSIAGLFWMYAVICVFAFIFGLKLLPETKGKTLEDIAKPILMRH
jgi:SP family sugar porter-like MFS transporter